MNEHDSDVPEPSSRLSELPRYGRNRAGQSVPFTHHLGSNEAPDAPSAAVQAAAVAAMAATNRYPDAHGETLIEALASRHGLPQEAISVSAGSIVMLDQLIRAYCDSGDVVVAPWRSYEAYPIIAGGAGANLLKVPLDSGHKMDPDAILKASLSGARIVLLCNPNNPTGTALSQTDLDDLLEALPRSSLIILDEAYVDYSQDASAVLASPSRRLARHPNLAVLRTFSKAWGLAGMRVGYCLSDPQIIAAINAVAPPFPLSKPALAAALAALGEERMVATRVKLSITERRRMSEGLAAIGLPVAPSEANFVWLAVGKEAEPLTAHLNEAGIAVRCFPGEGVRITVGKEADTGAVLAAARGWVSKGTAL